MIRAADKAGNVTEYTVTMKPISSITDAIEAITIDNIKSTDADTVEAVERKILDITEVFDKEESTDAEWRKLTGAAAKCKLLGGDNLTDTQRIELEGIKGMAQDYLKRISQIDIDGNGDETPADGKSETPAGKQM